MEAQQFPTKTIGVREEAAKLSQEDIEVPKDHFGPICADYTDFNKHYPKDHFGPPRIDQVVDSTAGASLLSFLDCYSGYHQIALKEEDQIHTSFITPFGAYCYTTMAFGLKNAGATYQGHPVLSAAPTGSQCGSLY